MAINHHVVYNDDIDGIVSAAIYLHNIVRGATYRLYPISSSAKGEKFKSIIKEMNLNKKSDFLVILNFENHEDSDLWIDHHWSDVMGNDPVRNAKVIYDPSAKSSSRLVQSYNPREDISKYPESFIDHVDMISQSSYKAVDQVFTDTGPMMILRAYVEKVFPSEMIFNRVVEMIVKVHFDFRKAMYQLRLDKNIIFELKKEAEKIGRFMTVIGPFSTVSQRRVNQYPKYSEFFIRPETQYAVRFSSAGNNRMYMQIASNKWGKPNEINLGKMVSNIPYLIRGGGHYSVASALLEVTDLERLLEEFELNLNKEVRLEHEEEMEKNAVDKELDPVESKAEEMVKTGDAKDIDEARKKASDSEANADQKENNGNL